MYRTDNWIIGGCGWIVELIEPQYINVSTYRPLSVSSYIKLPVELKSPKGLTNIKNNNQKCFLWCHARNINPMKINSETITRKDKELANDPYYDGVEFPVRQKDFNNIETKNSNCINLYFYENKLTFPIYVSDQKFEKSIDLLFVIDENKSHYMYIEDFDRFMFHKTKNKNKNTFSRVACSVLDLLMCWQKIKKFVWALMVHNL